MIDLPHLPIVLSMGCVASLVLIAILVIIRRAYRQEIDEAFDLLVILLTLGSLVVGVLIGVLVSG